MIWDWTKYCHPVGWFQSARQGMKAHGRGLSPTFFSDIDFVFGNTDMIVWCVCLSNSDFAVMDKTYHFQLDVKVH